MATINTIHDLFQLLRDNPEWAHELRTLVLTTELIDLPRKFEEFAEETRAHNAATDAAIAELRHTAKETQKDVKDLQHTTKQTQKDVKDLQHTTKQTQKDVKDLQSSSGDTQSAVKELQDTVKVMQDDLGELKGFSAMNVVLGRPDIIVFALSEDLLIEKVLTAQDLVGMIRSRPDVVPQDDRMSFIEADIVIHAKDSAGKDHYIAAEVSYTVGSSDVDRAIRNSEFLKKLTDEESHAMVIGSDINGTATMIVEREGVHWYQLRRHDTRPR